MNKKMRRILALALALVMACSLLTACGSNDDAATTPDGTEETTKKVKVGVINTGTAETMAWTRAHKEGVDYLQNYLDENNMSDDVQVVWVENVADAGPDCGAMIDTLVAEGCNLILTTSYGFMQPTQEAAKKYPDVMFYHNQSTGYFDNMGVYDVRDYEAVFVTGYLAARVSEGDFLGYVGTNPMPTVIRAANAFALGAKYANPNVQMKAVFTNSWYDVEKEKTSAQALIDDGAKALGMQVSSSAVVQTAQENGIVSVGFSDDMKQYAPESVLCSFKWNWGPQYVYIVENFINGTLTTGSDLFFGLEEGCGGFTDYNADLVSEEIMAECDALYEQLKAGEVKVFHGVITDNEGNTHGVEGEDLSYDEIRSMDWLVDFMAGTVG